MQNTTQILPVLLLGVLLLLPFETAQAKKPKLIRQTPMFDTSGVPKPSVFKFTIRHTEILFPEDSATLLHGKGQMVNLRGDKTDTALRGRVTATGDSTVNTRQYGVNSRFYVDLRKLTARSAPELAWLMQSEIAASRLRVAAEVARSEQLMERELRSRQPQPDFPPMPAPTSPAADPSNKLAAALAQSQMRAEQDSRRSIREYEAAVSQGQGRPAKLPNNQIMLPPGRLASLPTGLIPPAPKIDTPQLPSQPNASIPPAPEIDTPRLPSQPNASMPSRPKIETPRLPSQPNASMPSRPKADTSASERQMAEELAKANLLGPSEKDVSATLERARKHAQDAARPAQTVMDMVLTHLRPVPSTPMSTGTQVLPAPEEDAQSIIQWDTWHSQFANLARKPILRALAKCKYPEGANTIVITVWPNHHLAASVKTKSGNAAFDAAILEAYQSLDGNPALEYPPGSRRRTVTFLIDNKHQGTGVPSAVKSETSIGDKEILRHQR